MKKGELMGKSHMVRALQFIEDNPSAWEWLETTALRFASEGRKFSIRPLAEGLRWEHFINHGEDDFKVNNIMLAALARLLVFKHPVLKEHMFMRKSLVDEFLENETIAIVLDPTTYKIVVGSLSANYRPYGYRCIRKLTSVFDKNVDFNVLCNTRNGMKVSHVIVDNIQCVTIGTKPVRSYFNSETGQNETNDVIDEFMECMYHGKD